MTTISFEARDGLTIPAYLTTPQGEKAENLPTVVFPHGGPHLRDLWGYNYFAQFLASRGYAVFQPNFRGSSGYGIGFENAGKKNWGLKMQDDVTDGVKMLIEKGIADPKRICIVGGSYGAGNYAMCGRAFDPLLTFAWPGAKCAVMGAAQSANTLLQIDMAARKRRGEEMDEKESQELLAAITASYDEQQDIRYGAARGWVDRIIEPAKTREELTFALQVASTCPIDRDYKTGVLQT